MEILSIILIWEEPLKRSSPVRMPPRCSFKATFSFLWPTIDYKSLNATRSIATLRTGSD